MRVPLKLLLAAALALSAVELAAATPPPDATRLTEVARVYSRGIGEIRCPTPAAWDADFGSSFSSAYTNLRDDYTVLPHPSARVR
jgi:hypothetical protein